MTPALAEPAHPVRREAAHIARRRHGYAMPKALPDGIASDREPDRPAWRRLVRDRQGEC